MLLGCFYCCWLVFILFDLGFLVDGWTVAHHAVASDNMAVLHLLHGLGANLLLPSTVRQPLAAFASAFLHANSCECWAFQVEVRGVPSGSTPLHKAVLDNAENCIVFLLNTSSVEGIELKNAVLLCFVCAINF